MATAKQKMAAIRKVAVERARWPAGSAGGKGGRFAPKNRDGGVLDVVQQGGDTDGSIEKGNLSHVAFVKKAEQVYGDLLADVDAAMPDRSKRSAFKLLREKEAALKAKFRENPSSQENRKAFVELKERLDRIEEEMDAPAVRVMEKIRERILKRGLSRAEAIDMMQERVTATDEVFNVWDEQSLEDVTVEAIRMTKGKLLGSFEQYVYDRPRASAGRRGYVNVGDQESPSVIFHELGHHVEFSDDRYRDAARDFVLSRATGPVTSLNKITGASSYTGESAYPGRFIHPYVGKVYSDGDTEAISTGFQNFYTPHAMASMYRKDPEHFKLILGILED